MPFIKLNPLVYFIAFSTIVFLIFSTTFGGVLFAPAVIMYMLILSSIVLNKKFVKTEDQPEPSQEDFIKVGIFAAMGFILFLILNIFVPELKFGSGATAGTVTVNLFTGTTNLAIGAIWSSPFTAAFVFGALLVPVAEELFFRVLIGNIALRYLPFFVVIPIVGAFPILAVIIVGIVFSTFHLAAYGLNWNNLVILWGAGMGLYSLDLEVGNPLPSIAAHALNNISAFLLGGNLLLQLVPSLGSLAPQSILPLLQFAPFLIVAVRGAQIWIRKSH